MTTYDAKPSAFTQLTTTGDWESLLSSLGCLDGIDSSKGSAFTPSLDASGRNIVIADGQVVVKGMLWSCDAPVSTPIPAASAQNRLDRIVIRLTRGATSSPNVIQPVVITGTPSGSPVLPPYTQTPTGIFDIPVANWLSTSAGAVQSLVDERRYNRDRWINVTPPSGWSGINRYKRFPELNFVVVDIQCNHAGAAGNITFMTLPSGYAPANLHSSIPAIANNADPVNSNQRIDFNPGGAVTTYALPAGTTTVKGTWWIPLD
jgi:hypothetical protein